MLQSLLRFQTNASKTAIFCAGVKLSNFKFEILECPVVTLSPWSFIANTEIRLQAGHMKGKY